MEGFKKCYLSNEVDGTYHNMLWDDSEEGGNVRSECEEDGGTVKMETVTVTDW
jgi:hypothetical protein